MCTLVFLKDVLSNKKSLMKNSQITGIPEIPRIPEINAETIWRDIKNELTITKYFPHTYIIGARIPELANYFHFFILQIVRTLFFFHF